VPLPYTHLVGSASAVRVENFGAAVRGLDRGGIEGRRMLCERAWITFV
jgi:hypothetical protein